MPKRFKQLVALLMITMLLLMYVPIQAQDTTEGSLRPSHPPGRNVIEVEVTIEDQDNPGVFVPAEGIWVSYKHHQVSNEVHGIYTDANGYARIGDVPDGLSVVYLELLEELFPIGENYRFPEGYIQDDQAKYVIMNHALAGTKLQFQIRRATEDATGGIRLQKAYYP